MPERGPHPGVDTPLSNKEREQEATRRQKRRWAVEDSFWLILAVLTVIGILLYNWLPHLRR